MIGVHTTPRQTALTATGTRPRVLVTVSIRPKADTGVQVHVDGFMRYARERGIATTLITPFDAPAAMVYPFFGIGRVAKPFHKGAWLAWHRYSHLVMLRWRLQQALVGSTERHIVYAQSPVAARAALDMRAAGHQLDVVLAAHFNGSEADEWAVRGCVSRGDRLYAAMVEQTGVIGGG